MVNTDTLPSSRFATSASVPCRLIDTPAGARPVSSVAMTAGGDALRSITSSRLSAVCLLGSAGSIFWFTVTSARPSSGVSATDSGGPTTLPPAATSATTFGGWAPRSITVIVSGGPLGTVLTAPFTSTTLLSLTDTASCACAPDASASRTRTTARATPR